MQQRRRIVQSTKKLRKLRHDTNRKPYTPDQYLNSLMLGDAADYKDFPDIRFNQNTTNNIVLAVHPGYLLNGTFRDPSSDALQRFTNIGENSSLQQEVPIHTLIRKFS